jgi:PTS system mannitol-specific IIC component
MKPMLILAAIAGGISGVFTFSMFNAGLVASPSPGSIIALLALTPRGNYTGLLLGVIVATAVSFAVASLILKASKKTEEDLSDATEKMEALKGKKSSVSESLTKAEPVKVAEEFDFNNVNKIIFACDAGMGSSAMGASILRNKVQKADIKDVEVTNTSINNIPNDADIVITHKDLTDRAKVKLPNAHHVSVDNFLNSPRYEEIINELK